MIDIMGTSISEVNTIEFQQCVRRYYIEMRMDQIISKIEIIGLSLSW